MDLPDPNSYPRIDSVEYPTGMHMRLCAHCCRDELKINGNVDKHIMGCAFRSRYHAILHYNREQSLNELRANYARVQAALKKLDGE